MAPLTSSVAHIFFREDARGKALLLTFRGRERHATTDAHERMQTSMSTDSTFRDTEESSHSLAVVSEWSRVPLLLPPYTASLLLLMHSPDYKLTRLLGLLKNCRTD